MFRFMHETITVVTFLSVVSALVGVYKFEAAKRRKAKDIAGGREERMVRAGFSRDVAKARAKLGYGD